MRHSAIQWAGTRSVKVLTWREREILHAIVLGYTSAEIARRLDISEKTVETHRKHITTKLGLHSRAELVQFALRHGLLQAPARHRSFNYCSGCGARWRSRGEFLSDPAVRFVTYHPPQAAYPPGRMLFSHDHCGTSLPLALESFREITGDPVLADSCAVSKRREHCLSPASRGSCPPRCACAFVWRVSRLLRSWPKDPVPAGTLPKNPADATSGREA